MWVEVAQRGVLCRREGPGCKQLLELRTRDERGAKIAHRIVALPGLRLKVGIEDERGDRWELSIEDRERPARSRNREVAREANASGSFTLEPRDELGAGLWREL